MAAKSTEMKIREQVTASVEERMSEYVNMSAVALRKSAAVLGVKGASRGRKSDLLKAVAEILIPQIEREVRAAYAKPAKSLCAECGEQPIDRKTQGRDSTMCRECFDYAGDENLHSDDDHETKIAKTGQGVVGCRVCAEFFDRDAKSIVSMIAHKKARWFAESAEAAGWKIVYGFDGATGETMVTATRDGAEIKLVWEGRLYIAKRSDFRDATGRRQLRNASAAVKAVQTPSKADLALAK